MRSTPFGLTCARHFEAIRYAGALFQLIGLKYASTRSLPPLLIFHSCRGVHANMDALQRDLQPFPVTRSGPMVSY